MILFLTFPGSGDEYTPDASGKLGLNDFKFISTLGTGTFGRVRLVKCRDENFHREPLALKCLKKTEIIRLK